MTKPAEQGDVWEWRAFGALGQDLLQFVESHPVRMGINNAREEDLYLISPTNDQNIKLRRAGNNWLLKLKLLLETRDTSELYRERSEMVCGFPIPSFVAGEVASLLDTRLPSEEHQRTATLDRDQFVRLMAQSSPAVKLTPVLKTRSQFEFNGVWVEIASAIFPLVTVQSISIQSFELSALERIKRDVLNRPDGSSPVNLTPMNYVQACRRWM